MISYVDLMLGGTLSLSLASSNVILSASESRNVTYRLTGVLLSAVQITTSCVGFFFVDNATTGSFAVTVTNGIAGVAVPQGTRATLIADGTNGVRIASQYLGFVGGVTKLSFNNTTVPTGWLIDTTVNNGTFRLVSSAGGGTGGTVNFTDAFKEQFLTRAMLPNDTVTTGTESQDHTHSTSFQLAANTETTSSAHRYNDNSGSTVSKPTGGASQTHTHNFALNGGVTQAGLGLAVKYRDMVLGTLNG